VSTPETRERLLDAAEQLMLEEGYAAVTSRRVGAKAGISPQLVHYHFGTMDDLFLEVFRRRAEEGLERLRAALVDPTLRTVWEFRTDPPGAAFNIEFNALANHRKAIRAEIAHYAEQYRQLQLDALTTALAAAGIPAETCPPVVAFLAMTGLSQVMALEKVLDVTSGHEDAVSFMSRFLDQFDPEEETLA
jgi:AcrR family transcriptional regulator